MRKYLIDGNNVIHSDQNLKSLFNKDKVLARDTLISLINDFMLNSKNEATIFFDGFDYVRSFSKVGKNVFVKFAKNNPADKAIRISIDNEKNKKVLIVVSSDLEVQNYARINLSKVLSSEEFLKLISKSKKSSNPKYNGKIADNELKEWIEIFEKRKRDN